MDRNPDHLSLAVEALNALMGDRLSLSPAIREQHGKDLFHAHSLLPDAVATPQSEDEIVTIVGICSQYNVPVIPFGAGTSIEGHIAAPHGGLSLDLSRMNQILSLNVEDLDVTVEPGVTHGQLNHYLRDRGLFFPVDPGADATLGGMTATRASGTNAVRYGTMRENVLSLRAVLADGRVIKTGGRARKSAAGYDLTRLFVGSEGSLGIFTQITLRLYGIPEEVSVARCSFRSMQEAVYSVIETIQLGIPIARIELLDECQMQAINQYSHSDFPENPTLYLEFHGSPEEVRDQTERTKQIMAAKGAPDFVWTTHQEEKNALWKSRHEAVYATMALRPGATAKVTDVCVPISRLAECILETQAEMKNLSFPATIAGHVGDGNFHVILMVEPEKEEAEFQAFNARLVARALAMDGTSTGEHGIGLEKQDFLRAEHGDGVDLMRAIKQTLDPANILNPGKIFKA